MEEDHTLTVSRALEEKHTAVTCPLISPQSRLPIRILVQKTTRKDPFCDDIKKLHKVGQFRMKKLRGKSSLSKILPNPAMNELETDHTHP
mmetsp:Transcript_25705/g.52648  ORF Transcript_25705/g.52648 Transcript_25705/m.52648 type:complete len:90 (+) Transcript_25705:636-905(+)